MPERWTTIRLLTLGVLLSGGLAGCDQSVDDRSSANNSIAVSNGYLEAVVRDLADESVAVVRLAEPGMCPGHFDIRPSQIRSLRQCRLLLRFDFQQAIDQKLQPVTDEGLAIQTVTLSQGLGVPVSYLEACRQVGDQLLASGFIDRVRRDERLAAIEQRLGVLMQQTRELATRNGWTGRPVVSSGHQADFCRWLGLEVVAEMQAIDSDSIRRINEIIQAGNRAAGGLVIANKPEGRALADALAERLQARVVVFDNFPTNDEQPGFDAMIRANIARLWMDNGESRESY